MFPCLRYLSTISDIWYTGSGVYAQGGLNLFFLRCTGSSVYARGRQDANGRHDAVREPSHNPTTWKPSFQPVRRDRGERT